MTDVVNHPPHYTGHPSGVECITITEHMGFNLGNAVKYIWRADLKGNAIEDLRKAAWYVQREIGRLGGADPQPACPHAWEEANPGMWLCKECGLDVDLRNSPDWPPPNVSSKPCGCFARDPLVGPWHHPVCPYYRAGEATP